MIRPARPRKAAVLVVALGGAFLAIARTSGAGWVLVLMALLAGLLVAGIVAPVVPLARLRLHVAPSPDAEVGRPLAIELRPGFGTGSVLVRIPALGLGWVRARPGVAEGIPACRGIVEQVYVDAWCAAPLGLVAWQRRLRLVVPEPVHVAPAPSAVDLPPLPERHGRGDEVVRGVRRYEPGDPQRLVHWPSLARTGVLSVREFEAFDRPVLTVAVMLDGPAGAAEVEAAASQAAGLVGVALRAGLAVELWTAEVAGPVRAPVRTALDGGRRLAAAVAGPLPDGLPAGAVVVRSEAR
jgi:uncharacterized protein (DUF58 family)